MIEGNGTCSCGCNSTTTGTIYETGTTSNTGFVWSPPTMTNGEKNSFIDSLYRILEGPYGHKDNTHPLSPAERKIVQDKLIELVQSINAS